MRIQAGTGGRQQIGGDILPIYAGIFLQKCLDVRLHAFGQRRIGRRVIVGTGTDSGKFRAVIVVQLPVLPFHIYIVMIRGGTAPHIIILGKFLADIFSAHRLPVDREQIPVCLVRENQGGQPCQQAGEQQAAAQHQNNRNADCLTCAM